MSKGEIIQSNATKEYYLEERCFITEILNSAQHPDISISKARVEPGVTTILHRVKNTGEKYYILSGIGRMEIDGEISEVKTGDLVMIPADIKQRITNTGVDDLIFLCVCTPRFEMGNYDAVDGDEEEFK